MKISKLANAKVIVTSFFYSAKESSTYVINTTNYKDPQYQFTFEMYNLTQITVVPDDVSKLNAEFEMEFVVDTIRIPGDGDEY